MSAYIDLFFNNGLLMGGSRVAPGEAVIRFADAREVGRVALFFDRLADIETLVAALQKLGNDFAAAQPKPTYTDAALADFGCGPDAIARAEAEAEARDLNRLTGRDPRQCVRCGAVDCVCVKLASGLV